jgi:hypothetical protein
MVRFFARAAPARLAAVDVRRVAGFRPRAARLCVRDAAAPRFVRDFFVRDVVALDFLPARDFVSFLLAMNNPPWWSE